MNTSTSMPIAIRTGLRTIVLAAALTIAISTAHASNVAPGPKQSRMIAIVGGTVYTVSHGVIENGTVIIDSGKIIAVGSADSIPTPREAFLVMANGKRVYPGLIAPHTTLGLVEIDAVRATRDASEVGSINPGARGDIAYNPDSEVLLTVRTNGITTAEIAPQGGTISGTSALLNLDGWTREDATVRQPFAMHVNWPAMQVRRAWWIRESEEEQAKNNEKNLAVLLDAIRDARSYYLAKKAGVKNLPLDQRWEAMIPVFEGKIPMVVHATDLKQIQMAIDVCEREHIRMILDGDGDAWKLAPILKAKNIPVVLGRVNALPSREEEPVDMAYSMPARLRDAGVKFCLSEDGSWPQRNLPFQAATAIAYGLKPDEALRAVTLSTAEIYGVADRLGSIDVGKDANLVVSAGDILDIGTNNVLLEYVQGRRVELSNKQIDLYMKYQEKYQQWHATHPDAAAAGEKESTPTQTPQKSSGKKSR